MAFYNVRCRIRLGNLKESSWGFDIEAPVSLTSSEIQTLADVTSTEWLSKVGLFATDALLRSCTVQGFERVETAAGPPPVAHREPTTVQVTGAGAAAAGTVAGQSAAPQVALVVTFRTASPARRALGRCFTPPMPESVIDGAGLVSDSAARVTMVEDVVAAAEGALAPVDLDHIVFSTRYGDQNEVVTYDSDGIADTLRKRKQ